METYQLAVGEMPSHAHSASTNTTGGHNHSYQWVLGGSTMVPNGGGAYGSTQWTSWNGDHAHTVSVGNTGSSQSHNNMQPYITCYIWKRTA